MVALSSVFAALTSIAAGLYFTGRWPGTSPALQAADDVERFSCRPFLPKLFVDTPPPADHPLIRRAAERAGDFFSTRFAQADIDSLSIAVVTSDGPVFEQNYGVIRGNESATSPLTTSHASYRVASVAKLFAVLEGHILAERGVLSWDDPVEKFFPDFKYRLDGVKPTNKDATGENMAVTLFDLASHMSGMGRDWPPGTVHNWPKDMMGGGPPPTNGLPFPDHASLFRAIERYRLTSPPWSYPAYSNTATGLLGIALVAANRAASKHPGQEPAEYAELLQRDIFGPLGMNGSHFLTTDANKHQVVVPSLGPEVADQDFLDAMNPAGGQFSSLSDCIKITRGLLNPVSPESLISRRSMDRWLQPVHSFDEDDWTEIGFIWEIIKARDSNGRPRKIYWKLGAMAGYHAAIAIHPGASYGVVVLLGGHYPDAARLAYDAFELFQPAMDEVLAEYSQDLYAGFWSSEDGLSNATIAVEKGTLYMERMFLNDTDILPKFYAPGRLPLRSSERRDEFRLDTGIPGYNGKVHMGCYPYWNGQDLWGLRNDAPLNLLYFDGAGSARAMHVPSADVVMRR
ncbi:predicted protein [Postia placenta Mad-698-R]|nr:predicted protein [Postia placenta Mad-698-R]